MRPNFHAAKKQKTLRKWGKPTEKLATHVKSIWLLRSRMGDERDERNE